MTNEQRIAEWHHNPPAWARHLRGRDWDVAELVARQLDIATAPSVESCDMPPAGWYCTRPKGHEGPCAAFSVR